MNSNDQPKLAKWLTKRLLRYVAVISFFCSVCILVVCARINLQGVLFNASDEVINPEKVKGVLGMNKAAYSYFGLLPAMSILTIINGFLIWVCSKKFFTNLDK
jgi:hypothetical protein